MTDASDETLAEKAMKAPPFRNHLLVQLLSSLWRPAGISEKDGLALGEAAVALVQGVKPEGAIEEMLAVQMVATHEAAMEWLRRAMVGGQSIQAHDMCLKYAVKLMAIYERQMAAIDRHRGKGQQSVTVKYVHVAEGGQAIVGAVSAGGRARSEKRDSIHPTTRHSKLFQSTGRSPSRKA